MGRREEGNSEAEGTREMLERGGTYCALCARGVYVSLLVSRSRAGAKMAALTGTCLLRRGPWKPERSHRS